MAFKYRDIAELLLGVALYAITEKFAKQNSVMRHRKNSVAEIIARLDKKSPTEASSRRNKSVNLALEGITNSLTVQDYKGDTALHLAV